MPLLKVEAAKLSNNQLERGVVEEIIDREALFAILPFMPVDGKAYVYNRENALSEAEFISVDEVVPEGAATFTEVTTTLKILAGDVDVDKFLITTQSDTNDQLAIQLAQKAKAITRKFKRTLIIGDATANAKEFDGIRKLVTAGQTITAGANGAALTLGMLDELIEKVPNGCDVLMMRPGTWRGYRNALYALGGTLPEKVMIPEFGEVPAHNGVPVILNEFLPADEVQGSSSVTTSVYAMRLNEADGLHAIYGGSPVVQLEDIGTVQNKDAVRFRMKLYCGLVLKSTRSLARLKGITNI